MVTAPRHAFASSRIGRATVALALLAAVVAGCESDGNAQTPTGQPPPTAPRQHPVLEHIPLPVGFAMVPERSVARLAGPLRIAQCEFEGTIAVDDVAEFYAKHMPAAKFTLRDKRFDAGTWLMRFESRTEECNIRIKPKGKRSVIVIDLGPLPKSGADRPARAPSAEVEAPAP